MGASSKNGIKKFRSKFIGTMEHNDKKSENPDLSGTHSYPSIYVCVNYNYM